MRQLDWLELQGELDVLESLTDGFMALDEEWRIRYVNAAAEKANGTTRESLLGRNFWEAFPAVLGTDFERNLRHAMTDRVSVSGEAYYEPYGRWFEMTIHPTQGRHLAFFGRDITERKRAEEAQRRLQRERDEVLARLHLHFERMPIACILFDIENRITDWNPAAEAIFGHRWEEVLGKEGQEILVPPGVRVQTDEILRRLSAGDTNAHSVNENVTKDGRTIVCEWHNTPLLNTDGDVIAFMSMAQDITRRREAENDLVETRERLAADLAAMIRLQVISTRLVPGGESTPLLLEIVDTAIAVTDADMGNIELFDPESRALRIVASRGFDPPFLEFFNAVHAGEAACGTAMREGQRVIVEDVTTDPLFAESPSLDVLLAAGVRAVQSTPLVARSGRVVGMLSTHCRSPHRPADRHFGVLDLLARQAADWVERTQAEQALHASEERYRSLISQVKDYAIFSTNALGVVTTWNEGCQRVLDYDQQEFIGLDMVELFSPEDRTANVPADQLREAIDSGAVRIDRWMYARGGRRFYGMGATTALTGATGELIGFSMILRDVTPMKLLQDELARREKKLTQLVIDRTDELERTTEQLRLSERMASLGTLSAGLGHDLGNLLLPIDVRLKLLLDAALSPELHDLVTGIEKCTQYLHRLASGLRSLAVDPQTSLDGEATELRGWLDDVGIILKNLLGRDIALECHFPPGKCWVGIKPVSLTQVVFNLVQNAADALRQREAGCVTISAIDDLPAGVVLLQVTDNGQGMSPEVIRRCMEPYFSTKPLGESTGMGLTFVHRLVTGSGGRVDLDSIVGQGTAITLTLPSARPVEEPIGGISRGGSGIFARR